MDPTQFKFMPMQSLSPQQGTDHHLNFLLTNILAQRERDMTKLPSRFKRKLSLVSDHPLFPSCPYSLVVSFS